MISLNAKYARFSSGCEASSYQSIAEKLKADLLQVWINEYAGATRRRINLLEVKQEGTTFLFDAISLLYPSEKKCPYDSRLVVAFGISSKAAGPRDASRMQGFLGGGLTDSSGRKLDKGHAQSHAQGGGLDINLFPQNPEVNRGRKANDGTHYRKMEKYCADNPGTFFFSKLVYSDNSWVPSFVEYGVLNHKEKKLLVNQFIN